MCSSFSLCLSIADWCSQSGVSFFSFLLSFFWLCLTHASRSLVYKNGKGGAFAGPTLAGCSVAGKSITIMFNSTLLQGGQVAVKPYV